MTIAFAVSTLSNTSGIVKVVRNVANALAQMDHIAVDIICTGKTEDCSVALSDKIGVYNLDIDRYGRRSAYLKYAGALRELFSRYVPDVLVVSGMEHVPFYDAVNSILPHTKKIAWEHRNFSAGPRFRLEWLGKRMALKRWDGVLCITKKDYAQYADYQGSDRKLHQIYNLTDFAADRKPYSEDSLRIMSCGSLVPIKGYDLLLSVAEKIFQRKPSWTWDIYGEGVLREKLEQEICARGLKDHVRLKGFVSNVQDLYGDYGLFVLTSRAEGMGMVLIEAQKSGLPVISFDIPCGPSDVIADGENGYLIPAFDTDEMTEKIIALIEAPDKRKHFSDRSEQYHAEFAKEVILRKWKEMIGFPE